MGACQLIGCLFPDGIGGWVSTNYAVLACQGFPSCNGQWWPQMDFAAGFELLRELGRTAEGGFLPSAALVAIHWVHRLFALVVVALLLALAWGLHRAPDTRPWAFALVGLLLWQVGSGMANVVLQWPLLAALMHTAGAAAMVGVLTALWVRSRAAPLSIRSDVQTGSLQPLHSLP
ncbi:COX15/CtaA family protein [Ideonella paludis]|uniref:COX15/CtaA family protein n=1 Tax=Ideonella paludis TaxID=1233411 RepID=UPI00364494B6